MNNHHKFNAWVVLLCIFCWSCQSDQKAQGIVDRAISAHGGSAYESLQMEFDFRDKHYSLNKAEGKFEYVREFQDNRGQEIHDRLTNEGFERFVNGEKQEVSKERANAYSNSINSVMYFMLLPYGLNDDAVNKAWLGERSIKGKQYDLVKVTFDQNGGGEDHHDIYLYWFNKADGMVDYLAYQYYTDGGGIRFREAKDRRKMEGITIQDYNNYGPDPESVQLDQLDGLFEEGKLELLSEIVNENVQVTVN